MMLTAFLLDSEAVKGQMKSVKHQIVSVELVYSQ